MQARECASKRPADVRSTYHPWCIACGGQKGGGLGLEFREDPDGSVVATFGCDANYQGYPDRLHGGVIAMLFDAAMTNCLFRQGLAGVTARLNVSFREPVRLREPAEVRARVVTQNKMLYVLKAELRQGSAVKAWAEGKFVPKPE